MAVNDELRKQLAEARAKLPATDDGWLTAEDVAARLNCTSAEAVQSFRVAFEQHRTDQLGRVIIPVGEYEAIVKGLAEGKSAEAATGWLTKEQPE